MKVDEQPTHAWFRIVTAALRREDLFLRNYLQPYSSGAYEKWAPGIASLYEKGIVYLLIRELWCAGYPRAIGWELPFPDSPQLKIDLAIFSQRPEERLGGSSPEHLIEVKLKWIGHNSTDQLAVWWDLLRLLWIEKAEHRYVLLLTFGPEGALLGQDVDDLLRMRIGGNHEQHTIEQLVTRVITQDIQSRPYYLQHFDHVSELFWEEFETRLGRNQPGLVRVSLIEIFRKS